MAQIKKAEPAIGSQMRITDAELSLINNTFAGNDPLLKLLRKIFLPELDPKAPLGQNIDLWMTLKIDDMPMEQALVNLKARNTVISHIDQQLIQLRTLAGFKKETLDETKKRLEADSSK